MKQNSLIKEMVVLLFFIFLTVPMFGQTTIYKRAAVIPPRAADPEGYGNLVSGDVTGSGAPQIYAVSGELNDNPIVPRIYEFKWDGTKWDSVWASVPGLTDQNTWCPLAITDLDGDGRKEIVWGPVNASPYTASMTRLIVYEADGSGGDALGVPDGSGGYKPNATWNMLPDSASFSSPNSRPFKWVAADVNNDGRQELIFTTRTGNYHFGVISVDNIPDNGDGSETWKMDTTGIADSSAFGFSYPDLAVIDSTIYMFSYSSGDMQPIYYANGKYTFGKVYKAVAPGGTWKTAEVVDLDNTGNKEIIVGSVNDGKVYLLQPAGDSLSTTEIADFGPLGSKRLNGSAVGDFNGDGYTDIAFGSRSGYSTPDASIYVLYYKGGDITSMSSYATALADSNLAAGNQWDMLAADTVSTPHQIVYSGIDRSGVPAPIGVLSSMKVDSLSTIANARVDANKDYVPDSLGKTFKVIGVVNSVNWGASSGYFSYTIQDGSSGIDLYKSGGVGPMLKVGDRVLAKGTVSQYNGLDELTIGDFATDLTVVDSGRTITPKVINLADLNNGEAYESMLVTINGVAPAPSNTVSWPAANSNAGIKIWDGYNMGTMYIDKDGELDGTTEPTYPVDVTGVVSQYSSATPANSGYEIQPMFTSDFVQGVAAPPTPFFFFDSTLKADAMNGFTISDSSEVDTVRWTPSVDLNGDALAYSFQVYAPGGSAPLLAVTANNSGADTLAIVKATDVLKDVLKGADTVAVDLVIKVKSTADPLVTSVDTIHTMIINDIVTGIKDKAVPHTFFVDQNYPNPFNPSTTIRFGLQKQGAVNLIVYNILGQQVAVLLNHQVMSPGMHEIQFNASRLASGTYIYRLQAGNNVVNKKMILLK